MSANNDPTIVDPKIAIYIDQGFGLSLFNYQGNANLKCSS